MKIYQCRPEGYPSEYCVMRGFYYHVFQQIKNNIYNNVSRAVVIISKAIQNYYLIHNSFDNTVQFQLNFRVLLV